MSPRRPLPRAARLVPLALTALLALPALGCTATSSTDGAPPTVGATSGTTARSTTGSAPGVEAAPLRWKACGAVECATLTVPVDHADPDGPTVDLAVARRPARNAGNRIGSIVFNPGGPGAAGVDYVTSSPTLQGLNDVFDVVSWDPRGVGRSGAVTCGSAPSAYQAVDWSPDDETERRDLDGAAEAVAEACRTTPPELLDHLGTEQTVRDLDLLRAALGDEKLTYIGFSYGTAIGLRYAAVFPTHVRALVLDGVVDPTEDLGASLEGQTRAFERQVADVFARCERSTSCPVDDPGATYDRIAAKVERAPMGTGDELLGPTELAFAVIGAAYSSASEPALLAGLAAADRGDPSGLLALAQDYFGSSSYGSYVGTLCIDDAHPEGGAAYDELEDRLAAISPRFGAAIANEVRPCAFWPAPTDAHDEPVRAEGAAPILVVGNRGDFATPYAAAERVARDLDDGVLLTYDGEGHLSYGKSSCVDEAVDAYLEDLTVPDEGTTCD